MSHTTDHPRGEKLLEVSERGAGPELEAVRVHLAGCQDCQQTLAGLKRLEANLLLSSFDAAFDEAEASRSEAEPLPEMLVQKVIQESGSRGAEVISLEQRRGWRRAGPVLALAAMVMLSLGIWRLSRPVEEGGRPGDPPGVTWRGTGGAGLKPLPPLVVIVQADGQQEGQVQTPREAGPGSWAVEVPWLSLIQLQAQQPVAAQPWTVNVDCQLSGYGPIPLEPDGSGPWQAAGDETDSELPVGMPLQLAALGAQPETQLTCQVRRGSQSETVVVRLKSLPSLPTPPTP